MISGREETRIQQLLDGELPESAWPEVKALLESSEEARRAYCAHARLRSRFAHMRRERITLQTPAVPVDFMIESQRRRLFRWSGIAAAALILISALVMRLVLAREPAPTATLAAAADSRYAVEHAEGSTDAADAGVLRPGSRLRLEQGTIELEFASGVRSVVRGPADLTVVSAGEVHLDRGTGWFRVPENAVGFSVVTPRAFIRDLGTEFGVIARADLADSVHLFEGAAHVQTRFGAMESATLRGSEAREITLAGRLQETVPQPQRFLTGLPEGLPFLHWSFDEASPAAWHASGTMPEATATRGRAPAEIESIPGASGNALHRTGGSAWVTDWPGIAGNSPRTLSFWLRLPQRNDYIHPLAGWGHRYGDEDAAMASFFAFAETVDGVTVAGASLGGYWIKGTTRIDDDRWHHLAITASGRQLPDGRPEMRLFVDGREENVTAFWTAGLQPSETEPLVMATDTTHPEALPLSVLSQLFPGGQRGHEFPASIDELRVIEGVPTPADIQALSRSNPGSGLESR
ncbi:MAG: hypothetical protein RLZ97_720 [Verrucomicrobiota bacterium]|jgi:hypothetical protein